MTELRRVRGSWPREAVVVAVRKSWEEGWRMGIAEMDGMPGVVWIGEKMEKMRPMVKTMRAYGIRGKGRVKMRRMAAASAQRGLSPHHSPIHPSGARRFDPALKQSDSPAPTCMPLTTGTGVTLLAHCIIPVTLMIPTNAATTNPAAAFSSIVNFRAIATAAMAFMGCTGSGMPKATPVRMFVAPVNRRVEGRDIEFVRTRAVISGRSVPRSPSEPESSARG
jgi:hypothetical protein